MACRSDLSGPPMLRTRSQQVEANHRSTWSEPSGSSLGVSGPSVRVNLLEAYYSGFGYGSHQMNLTGDCEVTDGGPMAWYCLFTRQCRPS